MGDPRDITATMLLGPSHGGMITGGHIGDISIGASYSPTGDGHGFINGNVGVGIGEGVFIGYQYQYTASNVPIWQR